MNSELRDRVEELERALGFDLRPALMFCARLSKPEAEIVAALMRREICTTEQLHLAVYSDRHVDQRPEFNATAVHVCCARKKLGMIDVEITTLRYVGYAIDRDNRERLLRYMEKRAPLYMAMRQTSSSGA